MDLNEPKVHQPERWVLEEHWKQGIVPWESRRLSPYLCTLQRRHFSGLSGAHLEKHLRSRPILNANAIEFFLAHPLVIPKRWRKYAFYFWGTKYRERGRDRFVRGIIWNGSVWEEIDTLLEGYGWSRRAAAAWYEGVISLT